MSKAAEIAEVIKNGGVRNFGQLTVTKDSAYSYAEKIAWFRMPPPRANEARVDARKFSKTTTTHQNLMVKALELAGYVVSRSANY